MCCLFVCFLWSLVGSSIWKSHSRFRYYNKKGVFLSSFFHCCHFCLKTGQFCSKCLRCFRVLTKAFLCDLNRPQNGGADLFDFNNFNNDKSRGNTNFGSFATLGSFNNNNNFNLFNTQGARTGNGNSRSNLRTQVNWSDLLFVFPFLQ